MIDHKNKITSIHTLRGISAFSVMVFHFTISQSIDLSDDNILKLLCQFGHYGVDSFFIISGCVIPLSLYRKNYQLSFFGRYLWRRSIRIEIPYFATIFLESMLILLATLTPYREGIPDRLSWLNILQHIGYINVVTESEWLTPVFWTLGVEFQFYIIIGLTLPFIMKIPITYRVIFIVLVACIDLISFKNGLWIAHTPYFAIGFLIFLFIEKEINSKIFWISMLVCILINYQANGFGSFIVSILSVIFILYFNFSNYIFNWMGNLSYSLYLIHVPFGGRVLELTDILIYDEIIKTIIILILIPVTILFSYIFYMIFELPAIKLSSKIKYDLKT